VIEITGRVDELGHLLWAEHGGQSLAGFRKWNVLSQKVPSQSFDEQEAQGGHILRDRGWSQLLGLEQMRLVLSDLLGPELVRDRKATCRTMLKARCWNFIGLSRGVARHESLEIIGVKNSKVVARNARGEEHEFTQSRQDALRSMSAAPSKLLPTTSCC